MKKVLLFISLLLCTLSGTIAQRKQIDSLKQVISNSPEDTNKVKNIFQLSVKYQFYKPDSGIYIAQQAYAMATAIKYPAYQRRSLVLLANLYVGVGNYTKAMQIYYDAIRLAESQHDEYSIMQTHNNMGSTYIQMEDYPKALQYLRLAQQELAAYLAKNRKVDQRFNVINVYILNNLDEVSLKLNKLDSAAYYIKEGMKYQQKVHVTNFDGIFQWDLGELESRKGNANAALMHLHVAEKEILKEDDLSNLDLIYFSYAQVFKRINKPDSAIFYAQKALSAAREGNFLPDAAKASKLLYELFDQQKNIPLAYKYYKMASQINDSLINKEKIRALASLDFEAKQRELDIEAAKSAYKNTVQRYILLGGIGILALLVFIFWRNGLQREKANSLLRQQKIEIETTLEQLKATQKQLIQSEKMASLGELTAGIAHEIQNPLNFVNNFSEINKELLAEMNGEIDKGNMAEVKAIAKDVSDNEEKIIHHGKRADAIVKGMLQHSRSSSGTKEATDINALCDEYLRLAYHGLRAKDKSFNAELKTGFDESIGKINIISQDMGRVILNLITNAFYAVDDKRKAMLGTPDGANYHPTVTISTRKQKDNIEISVKDNGNGIPNAIKEKIFQPFFTTKPTGQGTGLGLSLSYDIVKAHGGLIQVDTVEGQYTRFIISLPLESFPS